jgi:hypothetical protein
MPAAAAGVVLDIAGGVVLLGGIVVTAGGVVSGGGAAAVPAIALEAEGGGVKPGAPAAMSAPLPAGAGARMPALLCPCDRAGPASVLAGLHALNANTAITPTLHPHVHSRICDLFGQPRPTESVRPPHPRVRALMPRIRTSEVGVPLFRAGEAATHR